MKTRNDFVSNSSSSSFIVIAKASDDDADSIKKTYAEYSNDSYVFPNDDYKNKFGWEFENTTSFGGKLNFIGIQLLTLKTIEIDNDSKWCSYIGKFDELYDMVKNLCMNEFGINVVLDESLIEENHYKGENGEDMTYHVVKNYYIDHQSCVSENECMDMFESYSDLYDFLCSPDSYIEGGNDNH